VVLSDEMLAIIRQGATPLPGRFHDQYFRAITNVLHSNPPTPLTNGSIQALVRDVQRRFNPAIPSAPNVQGKRLLPDNHEPRAVQYRALDDNAFAALEPQLLRAVAAAARDNDSVPADGPLREIVEQTPTGPIHRFLGTRSFVHDYKAPVRRVLKFYTSQGPMMTQR
jgi:hypothetical protein